MPPIPPERFARLFRGLDPDDRAAFVAALWSERGWGTTTEGDTVVATRDSETERVRVADPGRFRTPTLTDADVLVVVRDRDAVRAAAADAGVRYLAPDDVRDLLLYGLDRSAAATLFRQTFDRPLETAGDPTATPREQARALTEGLSARLGSRRLVALLLVGLFVIAAVGGPALTSQQEDTAAVVPIESVTSGDVGAVGGETTATQTATPATETSSNDRPPGIGERTLLDYTALADAHAAAVVGNSRTLTMEASGPPEAPVLNGREAWNLTARIEHSRQYLHDTVAQFPEESGSSTLVVNIYATGETKYRRVQQDNETTYRRYATETTGDASGFASDVREHLLRFLAGDDSTVECVATLGGTNDCFAYRVVVTGAPPGVHAEASNYRAVAIVQDDSIVASLDVRYTVPVDGERVPVRFRLNYDGFGDTTAPPPEWLPTAKNETGG